MDRFLCVPFSGVPEGSDGVCDFFERINLGPVFRQILDNIFLVTECLLAPIAPAAAIAAREMVSAARKVLVSCNAGDLSRISPEEGRETLPFSSGLDAKALSLVVARPEYSCVLSVV